MPRSTAVLSKPVGSDHDVSEAPQGVAFAPRPRASRGSGATTIDLLLIYSPTARPLPSRNGVRRWEYRGRIYRELPLEALYAWDDEDRSTREFRQMDSLMRAKPHRLRAA